MRNAVPACCEHGRSREGGLGWLVAYKEHALAMAIETTVLHSSREEKGAQDLFGVMDLPNCLSSLRVSSRDSLVMAKSY